MSVPLTSLEPRWVCEGERRTGVSWNCPACLTSPDPACSGRVFVFVDPPLDRGPTSLPAWKRTGDTFETLTLTPSILTRVAPDGSTHWHGFVTNGQVTP